jgi:hypothetical protein
VATRAPRATACARLPRRKHLVGLELLDLPSASTSTETCAGVTLLTFTPVRIVMSRREKSRAIWVEASSSSIGNTRGRASSTVTCVPYAA